MSKAKKLGLIGAGVGFCLALLMSAFAYYSSSHHLAHDFTLLYLCLAPTSIVLVVTDWRSPADAMFVLVFALSNSLVYGFVFLVIGKIWNLIQQR